MTPKKPVKRGRGPQIWKSDFGPQYVVDGSDNHITVWWHDHQACFQAKRAHELAKWLIAAAEYLEQRGEK